MKIDEEKLKQLEHEEALLLLKNVMEENEELKANVTLLENNIDVIVKDYLELRKETVEVCSKLNETIKNTKEIK
jgi:response regulator RpfG family c-di-GMP phosphodiesterase